MRLCRFTGYVINNIFAALPPFCDESGGRAAGSLGFETFFSHAENIFSLAENVLATAIKQIALAENVNSLRVRPPVAKSVKAFAF